MSSNIFLLVLICFVLGCAYGNKEKKWKDYTYKEATKSFYKIHDTHVTWFEARKICSKEDALLFYPEDKKEARMIFNWWKSEPVTMFQNYREGSFYPLFHVGLTKFDGDFRTDDVDCSPEPVVGQNKTLWTYLICRYYGRPMSDVYHEWHAGEPTNSDAEDGSEENCMQLCYDLTLNDIKCNGNTPWTVIPFVCKRTLESVETWNTQCDLPNLNYTYNKESGSCYLFHSEPKTWLEAQATCKAEYSYLAVINSRAEAEHLARITAASTTGEGGLKGAVLLGFHNRNGTGWETVQGNKLEETGYTQWGNQQPDGGDHEKCGSMFDNGRLNDISCSVKASFICEHEL